MLFYVFLILMRTLACVLEPFWLERYRYATGYAAPEKAHNNLLYCQSHGPLTAVATFI
jgi:hypothetical protein